MAYATEHADALAALMEAGAPVTFTKVEQVYDASTGASTTTQSSVAGQALQMRGSDPQAYARVGLTPDVGAILLFAPTVYGEEPELGATVVWGGESYSVQGLDPVAPDGTSLLVRVGIRGARS